MGKRALTLVSAAVLLLTACGGGDSTDDPTDGGTASTLTADEQTAADNLAAQIIRSGDVSGKGADDSGISDDQARCIAEGAVAEVGLANLQDYGILTDDLLVNKDIQGVEMSADDADALAGVFVDCIDAEALFEKQFLAATGSGKSDKVRKCIDKAVDEAAVRGALSASFQGRSTAQSEQLTKQVSECSGGPAADE
jgi:hypothetical protein